jgi:hypothetical protein
MLHTVVHWNVHSDQHLIIFLDFTVAVASAYMLSITRITLSNSNNDLYFLESLLGRNGALKEVWQQVIQHLKRQLTGPPNTRMNGLQKHAAKVGEK